MAKQYKKLRQKVHPKQKKETPAEQPPGNDYLLIGIIIFTLVILAIGWQHLNGMNCAMYLFLLASLGLTYIRRHMNLSETQQVMAERAGLAAIGIAIALFFMICYEQFFG